MLILTVRTPRAGATTRPAAALTLLLTLLTAACGGEPPIGPGNVVPPQDRTPQTPSIDAPASRTVSGTVTTTAFSPIAGARVAIMSTDLSTLTDDAGRFDLRGSIDSAATVQVTKEGYISQTRDAAWTACPPGVSACLASSIGFLLKAVAPATDIAGDYDLAIVADTACDLPAEARTRTYRASIASVSTDNMTFDVRISGPLPLIFWDSVFTADMSGEQFTLGLYGSWVHQAFLEKVAPDTYVGVNGRATATVPPGASTISARLDGTITHCRTSVPLSEPVYGCVELGSGTSGRQPESFVACTSKNHQMLFTRR